MKRGSAIDQQQNWNALIKRQLEVYEDNRVEHYCFTKTQKLPFYSKLNQNEHSTDFSKDIWKKSNVTNTDLFWVHDLSLTWWSSLAVCLAPWVSDGQVGDHSRHFVRSWSAPFVKGCWTVSVKCQTRPRDVREPRESWGIRAGIRVSCCCCRRGVIGKSSLRSSRPFRTVLLLGRPGL